jgi:LysM repeat protein
MSLGLSLQAPPAKFKFGAIPNVRRLTFTFNVYSLNPNVSTSTVQMHIAGRLSNWSLVGGSSGVNVSQLAGLGFFAVRVLADVYSAYDNAMAGRALSDDLSGHYIVSNMAVNGAGPTGTNTAGSYTVVAGDTLSKIAARYGTTWQALAALNGLTNPNLLEVGQVLRITGTTTQPSAPQQTAIPPPVIGSGSPPPSGVKSGIEDWAAKLGLSVSALALLGVVAAMVISRRD